jgi:hypothetical protein
MIMGMSPVSKSRTKTLAAAVHLVLSAFVAACVAATPGAQSASGSAGNAPDPVVPEDPSIPLNEAVVDPPVDAADESAPSAPPENVVEDAPTQPDPDDTWIPGYWWWSDVLSRFAWVAGAWRNPPPDRTWAPGSWIDNGSGRYIWSPGNWAAKDYAPDSEAIREAPPALRDEQRGSSPDAESVWTPGYYKRDPGSYAWVDGSWGRPPADGLVWVEPRFAFIGGRYYFLPGRWDRAFEMRGTVYRPDINVRPGAHLALVAVPVGLVTAHARFVTASAHVVAAGGFARVGVLAPRGTVGVGVGAHVAPAHVAAGVRTPAVAAHANMSAPAAGVHANASAPAANAPAAHATTVRASGGASSHMKPAAAAPAPTQTAPPPPPPKPPPVSTAKKKT